MCLWVGDLEGQVELSVKLLDRKMTIKSLGRDRKGGKKLSS